MTADRTAYDEKLDSILSAAAVIFAEKGYHNASIRDIARATGVSLSGLYYYFQSKEELLFVIQDHSFGTLLEKLEGSVLKIEDPEEKIRVVIDTHLRFFLSNMPEMKVLSHEAGSLGGDYYERVNAKKRKLAQFINGILDELRPESDVSSRVATFALFGMMNWIYTWYRPDRDVGVDKLVSDMTHIFLSGYLSAGAGEYIDERRSTPTKLAGPQPN
jgi:TetR/AcrR family transcriptional regulator, cholesterol catabolism regulator